MKIVLRDQSVQAVLAELRDSATKQGYQVAQHDPGVFQVERTRRRSIGNRHTEVLNVALEAMDDSIIADFTGDIDLVVVRAMAAFGGHTSDLEVDFPVPSSAPESSYLLLPDGARRSIGRGLIVGRNPKQHYGMELFDLVLFPDMQLSRTHFAIFDSGSELCLVDLESTNGVEIRGSASRRRCEPGVEVTLREGDEIVAGSLVFSVLSSGVQI